MSSIDDLTPATRSERVQHGWDDPPTASDYLWVAVCLLIIAFTVVVLTREMAPGLWWIVTKILGSV